MAIASSISFTTQFDYRPSIAKFKLSDTTDYTTEGISVNDLKGNFKIVNPLGVTVYENTSWITPDIDGSVSLNFNDVTIGSRTIGYWTITYTIQVSGAVQAGIYSKEVQYNFQYQAPLVSIYQEGNPFTDLFKSTDQTIYNVNGVVPSVDRTHTVIYPELADKEDVVTSTAYIGIGYPNFIIGTWQTTISTSLVYNFGTFTVGDVVVGQKQIIVEAAPNIQDVLCCLDKLYNQILTSSGTSEQSALIEKFEYASGLLNTATQSLNYGRYTQARNYINQIYEITGCTPNCSCGSSELTRSVQYQGTTNNNTPTFEFPIGGILEYSSEELPEGWLWANGAVYPQSAYPELYAKIGNRYNTGGEGSGNFRVPRRQGVVSSGVNPMGGITATEYSNRALGEVYGAETVNYTPQGDVSQASVDDITATSEDINTDSLTVTSSSINIGSVTGSVSTATATSSNIDITGVTATSSSINIGSLTASVTLGNDPITGVGTVGVSGATCLDAPATEPTISVIDCNSSLTVDIATIASGLSSNVTVSSATVGGSIPTPTITVGGVVPTPTITVAPQSVTIGGSIPTPTMTVGGTLPAPDITIGGSIAEQTFTGTEEAISVLQPTIAMGFIIRYI